jgi:hypothetical protein
LSQNKKTTAASLQQYFKDTTFPLMTKSCLLGGLCFEFDPSGFGGSVFRGIIPGFEQAVKKRKKSAKNVKNNPTDKAQYPSSDLVAISHALLSLIKIN